jgi:uncharacterized DUF497 family protein
LTVFDRFENGEDRFHRLGAIGTAFKIIVVVFAFPDPENENLVRVISIRPATRNDRRRYEETNE